MSDYLPNPDDFKKKEKIKVIKLIKSKTDILPECAGIVGTYIIIIQSYCMSTRSIKQKVGKSRFSS
jgi:hypothetical protein